LAESLCSWIPDAQRAPGYGSERIQLVVEAEFATLGAAGASFLQWWRDYHALVKQQQNQLLPIL
jgi:hypothetical protein